MVAAAMVRAMWAKTPSLIFGSLAGALLFLGTGQGAGAQTPAGSLPNVA